MKIGPIENKAAVAAVSVERKTASAAAPSGVEASTQVELSAKAMLQGVNDDAVFDVAKVNRISDAIRDGKFEIDAEAIADKLIANAHDLLSPRQARS